jgi:hypothetical protein
MTSGDEGRQWHEAAQHLVQAHGALPGALTSYAPTVEQLRFTHADTHEALTGIGAAAPDGHTHTGSLDPGYPYARDSSFRPFPPGPNASRCPAGLAYFGWETGLPQTMWETGAAPPYREAFEVSPSQADPDGPEPEAGQ